MMNMRDSTRVRRVSGQCPNCEATIPEAAILIRYETSAGESMYAECPSCEAVVHPIDRS